MNFEDFKDIEGLTLIPLSDKIPQIKGWQELVGNTQEQLTEWSIRGHCVGISCGSASGGLEVIDVDSKYQLLGDNILVRWSNKVKEYDGSILDKVVVTRTQSGGYHILYRCTEVPVDGNQKLAMRPTVESESGKSVCLIETRGQGGQIHAYSPVKGDYSSIPTVSADERETLLMAAKMLNEVIVPAKPQRERRETLGLSPMDHYDNECDISIPLDLLLQHGWSIHADKGYYYELTRPGKRRGVSATLGYYDNTFYPWSSEGVFEDERAYTYAGVYTILEHDGDTKAATKALVSEGYGREPEKEETKALLDKMLGKEEEILTEEEEKLVMGRIHSAQDSMEHYLTYVKTKRNFMLEGHLRELQGLMKDIQPSHYVAWAAASGTGKTSVARQVFNSYLNLTDQVGIFASLEMPSRDLALRNAMELSDPHDGGYVDKDVVTDSLISDKEYREQVVKSWENFYTIDSSYDIDVIFNMAAVFIKQMRNAGKKVGAVVVDFLQLADGGHAIEKQPEIAQKMKMWAKKLDVITVGLLQLNSTIDKFTEPSENHISGHKALFQTADHGFFLWKNEVEPNRIIFKSGKERWSLEGKCDAVQTGMKIHSEQHKKVDKMALARKAGNSDDV